MKIRPQRIPTILDPLEGDAHHTDTELEGLLGNRTHQQQHLPPAMPSL